MVCAKFSWSEATCDASGLRLGLLTLPLGDSGLRKGTSSVAIVGAKGRLGGGVGKRDGVGDATGVALDEGSGVGFGVALGEAWGVCLGVALGEGFGVCLLWRGRGIGGVLLRVTAARVRLLCVGAR